jgi:hypothetical protein
MAEPRTRAKHLLVEIRRAQFLRDRLARDGEQTVEIDTLVGDLQRQLGALIVSDPDLAALLVPMIPDARPTQESFTDEVPQGRERGWYDDEKTGPIEIPDDGPLFDSGDLQTGDIPIPDDLHLLRESDDTDAGEQYAVETTASVGARAQDPLTGLGGFAVGASSFQAELQEFLDLLRPPFDLDDPAELGVEVSRVQWAANELDARSRSLPKDVTVALLGLIAARAQNLRGRLDVDVGIRRSLDRLQRLRIDRELPAVHALLPTPLPEGGSWLEDAEAWWAVFARRDRL